MLDVGLVGYGLAGRAFHAPFISSVSGLRLAAVVQRTGSGALERYPDVLIVRSLEDLLSIREIGLVTIATPNPTHFEFARKSMLAGKHVVVDKPFATSYEEGIKLSKIAQETGRILGIYQNRRWDGDFKTVRKLVENNTLGAIVLYESHFDRYRAHTRPTSWRERNEPGSGLLFDLGTHLIDQAMLLLGRPDAVTADIRQEREGAVVDDAFDVTLRYPSMRALLRVTMLASAPGPRFLLHGTSSTYVKYGLDPQEDALKRGDTPGGEAWGREDPSSYGILTTNDAGKVTTRAIPTADGDYRAFYENIRDAILGRAPLAVTSEQALDVLRALELARESSASGCTIPWH